MKLALYIVGVWLAFVLMIAGCASAFAEDAWQPRICKYADSIFSQYEGDMMMAYGANNEQMFFVLRDWTGVLFKPDEDGLYCWEAELNEEDTMILLHFTQHNMEQACPE
jgi:hypothetical protein